ncbi:MAG TPA: glycosyltransferase [Flavisolibacter sp.]
MQSVFFISLMNGAAWGGSEELWFRAALHAAGSGVRTACAVYDWPEKAGRIEQLRHAGCHVYLLPNDGRLKRNLAEKIRYRISRWRVKGTVAALPLAEYDMVVVNQGGFEIYTSTWKHLYRLLNRFAVTFHNYDTREVFSAAKAAILEQWIDRACCLFFASDRIRAMLEEKLSIPVTNAQTLINPVTINVPREPLPSADGTRPVLVMLAALDVSRKAQDELVRALATAKWRGRPWELHLFGEGNDRAALEQLVAENGLQERIFLEGHTDDVLQVLSGAHLVLQVTHRDAMPLAVMEAMAAARPVVVSNVGDMPLWVHDGLNGWVSGGSTAREIDAVLERAWQQQQAWPQMGAASFAIFREHYPENPAGYFLHQLQSCD